MMAAVAVPAAIQGTPEWLDARRDVVGSSDIPIITGSSPYRTSLFTLWALKTRLAEPEPVDPETQELYDLGHALEDVIAARYALVTERRIRRSRRLLTHPTERWMGASLDRVSARRGERRIIEIKWAPNRRWALDGPEPVPPNVQDQVQWQLAVTGYDVADVAVLSGSHVEVHEIGPSTSYQDDLRYVARDFWDRVEHGERPPIDGSESTRQTIARLHPRDTLGLMEPTPEVAALAYAIRDASAVLKAAKEEDGRLRNEMRFLLDDYSGVEDADYRIHYRRSIDSTVTTTDWQAIAAAYRLLLRAQIESIDLDEAMKEIALRLAPDDLDTIEALHTTTEVREGRRALLPKFRDADTGKWV